MKKKKIKSKAVKRTVKRKSSSISPDWSVIRYSRVLIASSALILLVALLFAFPNRARISRSVAGISLMKGMFAESTISWQPVSNAVGYNIYYKTLSDQAFLNAVRNIPANVTTYTISYLKNNTAYEYKVSALNNEGAEIWFSPVTPLPNPQSM